MQGKYNQNPSLNSASRFGNAAFSDVEHSRVTKSPELLTTFNAGDIVPIYCREVLPGESVRMRVDSVIRQTTLLTPTMGSMFVDICAYFVPNRIVNESWSNVMGENTSSFWTAPEVELASLYEYEGNSGSVQIPVGSVADYYGLPTQQAIPANILAAMHDLEFRGYLAIYNEWFRDQNYQPIIPFSKLNVYEGFLLPKGSNIPSTGYDVLAGQVSDGSVFDGSVVKALFGEGSENPVKFNVKFPNTTWSALDKPLKANKIRDYFTSVLPSPQKGEQVSFSLAHGTVPVDSRFTSSPVELEGGHLKLLMSVSPSTTTGLGVFAGDLNTSGVTNPQLRETNADGNFAGNIIGLNIEQSVDLSQVSSITLSDLRMGAAIQRAYETLARSGSRYRGFMLA